MNFKEAIKKMIEDGEFEKIIKYESGKEKKLAKKYYEDIQAVGVDKIPFVALLHECKSVSVLKNAIIFMMFGEERKID